MKTEEGSQIADSWNSPQNEELPQGPAGSGDTPPAPPHSGIQVLRFPSPTMSELYLFTPAPDIVS